MTKPANYAKYPCGPGLFADKADAYAITSPARRRNIRRAMDILKAEPVVTDDMILAAHAAGLDAREMGASIHDNPYVPLALREAFIAGWRSRPHSARRAELNGPRLDNAQATTDGERAADL